ncbi:transcriptional adapter ADA2-like isoform X2 [Lycium ferocissimum]|uniref:transcriptional adapter ADA2-like isoform X2 n=1 Tax=Lycium ferocissimum TaxID=112874 RepID=UPI002815C217|nr:transcriptional adapter ADA2-like isoform X2 [Lycium ferocissimum]XP_059282327.1 transcriptional adapter ADA2-like isoform X2 [Lycium ferocissimum]
MSSRIFYEQDNLSFPLICADWNADEEMLLLEGMEMYGLANWAEVAEHVGTKSKLQCIDHYKSIYINSPCFPLPDMSHVMGKNREELLAMAKEQGYAAPGGVNVKEESPFSARIKMEDQREENSAGLASVGGSASGTLTGAGKRTSGILHSKENHDSIKVEGGLADRSVGEKKPRTSVDEGPSMTELSGYNTKREEFEIEYDNDAEQMLADMEFKETDSNAERELKLRVLRIYSKRLDERKRRKDFILERNLLHPDPFEKDLTPEEKDMCRSYRVFMRFNSKEEHEEFLRSIIEEHRMVKRIQDLQDARAAGCRTSAEAERYVEQKRKRESEENVRRLKENPQSGPSGKYLQRAGHLKVEHDSSPRGVPRGPEMLDSLSKDLSSTTAPHGVGSALDIWDVSGFSGAELLSEAEKQLCDEIRILPTHYLNMLQTMSMGVLSGNITKKSDAHGLFNVDPNKVDKVYEMLVKKGLTQA